MNTAPEIRKARVLGPGAGDAIWFLDGRMTMKATAATTNGGYGLIEVEVPAGFSPPLHVHHREDESFYVLDGELTVRCGDDTYRAPAGSYVYLPRDVPHSFVVESDRSVRMLNITVPGGGEGFFVEAGRPAERAGLPPAASVDVARLRQAGQLYGSEVIGPPLSPTAA
jgi:quercetin dioxygenase-like cupin family protein